MLDNKFSLINYAFKFYKQHFIDSTLIKDLIDRIDGKSNYKMCLSVLTVLIMVDPLKDFDNIMP